MGRLRCALAALLLGAIPIAGAESVDKRYYIHYEVRLDSEAGLAYVRIGLGKRANLVRSIRFHSNPRYQSDFEGDGTIARDGEYVTWEPPDEGGDFRLTVKIDHRRRSGHYDAHITDDWAILRGDDLIPPAQVRTAVGAVSRARLRVRAPPDWSVYTAYPRDAYGRFRIDRPERRFDRPVGWIIAGKLGVRRERIGGISVVVAGPTGQSIRRQDILAFLNWNLPVLLTVFPDFPRDLLIVSAGDPMWRGGLSAPNSLYIHAERPLISGNGTSALLHELVHVATRLRGAPGADWIVEGLAEYYSLEILRRAGSITERRFDLALDHLAEWSGDVGDLGRSRAGGEITARAALVLRAADREIRHHTAGLASLDEVARRLVTLDRPVSLEDLRQVAADVAGEPLEALRDLPVL